jgi:hypothetical protein
MASGRRIDRKETLTSTDTEESSPKGKTQKTQSGSGNQNRTVSKENAREWSGREGRGGVVASTGTEEWSGREGRGGVVARTEERVGRDPSGQEDDVEPHFSLVQYEAPKR